MNNHQKSTFHPLGDFLNPALALLGQGLIKSPIWQKLNFANHPYLCKGLYKEVLSCGMCKNNVFFFFLLSKFKIKFYFYSILTSFVKRMKVSL
ncbi:hypothetical protein [Bathymodiolus heckerae thiotrophic gill symbiont]|uniref:hypothetical protein n=1 Tax=Bathymodiolus heckerae thiotrophic gill symbiont TaxID=1052212 RepID=UPI0010FE8050|nr:hypothetical protein [Bathymodiolus heckerae thiotrophic gill symbiont]